MNEQGQASESRFGALIRAARERKGWTQDDLVEESGVSRSTILRWEAGKADRPNPHQVRTVFEVLGIDPREVPVVLGYVTRAEMNLPPREPRQLSQLAEEVVAILEDGEVPEAVKADWVAFLRWRTGRDGDARRRRR